MLIVRNETPEPTPERYEDKMARLIEKYGLTEKSDAELEQLKTDLGTEVAQPAAFVLRIRRFEQTNTDSSTSYIWTA